MSAFRRIWKISHIESKKDDSGSRGQLALASPPRRTKSVANLVAKLVGERKTTASGAVEFKAPRRQRRASDIRSTTSSNLSSVDIQCPSELGRYRASVGSDALSVASFSLSVHIPPAPRLPAELVAHVIHFSSTSSLPTLSRVCRVFHAEATRLLYHSIDLIPPACLSPTWENRMDLCIETLASSLNLSALVREFKFAVSRSSDQSRSSIDKLRTVLFNLVNLKSLWLENSPLHTLLDMPFSLTHLHVEFSFLYSEANRARDLNQLGSWLTTQSCLISLHLLNCDSITLSNAHSLPHLTEIAGCATVASTLTLFRPVSTVSIRLQKADEARTTPSRIMASLARSTAPLLNLELDLTSTDLAYETFLTAAVTRLQFLRSLTVSGTIKSLETLFKHIHHVLLPLTTLNTIRVVTRPQIPHNHEVEFARVKIWYKLCPTLRVIQFPSRMEWFIAVDEDRLNRGLPPLVRKRLPDAEHGLRRLRLL